jgi:hypothetical protein
LEDKKYLKSVWELVLSGAENSTSVNNQELINLMNTIESAEWVEGLWGDALKLYYDNLSNSRVVDYAKGSLKISEVELRSYRRSIQENKISSRRTEVAGQGKSTSLFDFIYPRYNVQVYLSDGSESSLVHDAINEVLYALGCDGEGEPSIKKSSWSFSRLFRSFIPKDEEATASSIRDAIETLTVDKVKAESDAALAAAVANLITSLQNETHAAVRVGTILIVKNSSSELGSNLATCTLSVTQSKILDKFPELLNSPSTILNSLGINHIDLVTTENYQNNYMDTELINPNSDDC